MYSDFSRSLSLHRNLEGAMEVASKQWWSNSQALDWYVHVQGSVDVWTIQAGEEESFGYINSAMSGFT